MMKSAKILFTLVCAGALGAVAIACTVSSGTVDDTDGGSSSGQASSSSSSSGSSSSSSSSSSSGTVAECAAFTGDTIDSKDCDTCLRHSCCTETAGCQNPDKAQDSDAGLLGCDGVNAQYLECDKNAGSSDPNDCKDLVNKAAQPGIPDAYDAYLGCRETNCATQCGDVAEPPPDGGTK